MFEVLKYIYIKYNSIIIINKDSQDGNKQIQNIKILYFVWFILKRLVPQELSMLQKLACNTRKLRGNIFPCWHPSFDYLSFKVAMIYLRETWHCTTGKLWYLAKKKLLPAMETNQTVGDHMTD